MNQKDLHPSCRFALGAEHAERKSLKSKTLKSKACADEAQTSVIGFTQPAPACMTTKSP